MSPIPIPHSLQIIRLHPRDFISPSPSPQPSSSSKGSSSFTSNPSLPWIIIGIVVGLTILATSTTLLIIYYNRRQRQKTNPNSNPQLVTPITHQQEQSSPLTLNFLRRKSTPATSQFEQEELQRASMIRKSYASRSWNSLSLDSQMSISMSQLSPTRTAGTYGSSSRVNTLERINTLERVNTNTNTNLNNTYNEEDLEMETPATPTELRGTTATEEERSAGSRLKDDWKAWEARVKLERSVSGELHPACAGAETAAETEEVAVPRSAGRTTRVEVPIPPRHPGRVASPPMNMI